MVLFSDVCSEFGNEKFGFDKGVVGNRSAFLYLRRYGCVLGFS